MILHKFFKRA